LRTIWCKGLLSSGGVVDVGSEGASAWEALRCARIAWEERDERMLEVWMERCFFNAFTAVS